MILVAAGLARSGSTWQYNALRFLLQRKSKNIYSAWVDSYDASRREPIHVVKLHAPWQCQAIDYDHVVTSYRDLRDVIKSLMRMKWMDINNVERIQGILDTYISDLYYWESRSTFIMRYEDMEVNKLNILRQMSSSLGLRLSKRILKRCLVEINGLKPPHGVPDGTYSQMDPVTLLHAGHIGDDNHALPNEYKLFIEKKYECWLRERGYIC